MSSLHHDEVSTPEEVTEPIQLSIDERSMRWDEIQRTIELMIGGTKSSITDETKRDGNKKGNSLNLTSVGLNTRITEDLIRLIRQTKDWDSISLTNSTGDRTLCNDLLLACTTHSCVRSLAWRARIADAINARTTRILVPTDLSTVQALLYGLKYGSHLTKLEATGLVLDANMANLLSRCLVRNTVLKELILNGTRFLSENSNNDQNHRGTKNITVQTLSFGLRFNRTIESLSFDMCNDLEDEDIACLINAVNSDGTVLRRLSLQETACFDQGMSSVAVLLQENVIEDLNLSYLVRRQRKSPPKEEKEPQQENMQDDEDEDQQAEDEQVTHEEIDETKSDQGDKNEVEERREINTKDNDQTDEENRDEKVPQKDDDDEISNDKEKEEERQKVQNTSLKVLSMAGNFLDDEYLESLLNIFPSQTYPSGSNGHSYSRLEELTLLGNRFSNHGIKQLLKKLTRFPYLQRLYLGYQRSPPPQGPKGFPRAILTRMLASNPSLADRNTQFTPGSLRKEFVAAVSENPRNFLLTDVNFMAITNEDKNVDEITRYHMMLNRGGRRLLASYGKSNYTSAETEHETHLVPLGLWPLVVDRANRLYPLPISSPESKTDYSNDQNLSSAVKESTSDVNGFHAGDVIFSLLHGPMVFENLHQRHLKQ